MLRSRVRRIVFSLAVSPLMSLGVTASMHALNLNDPIVQDTGGSWMQISPYVSAYFAKQSTEERVTVVIEKGEFQEPITLSLEHAHSAAIGPFLKECEKILNEEDGYRNPKHVGVIVHGSSFRDTIKGWAEHLASQPVQSVSQKQAALRVIEKSDISSPFVISYGFLHSQPQTLRDIRKLWVTRVVQELAANRLHQNEGAIENLNLESAFLLPQDSFSIKIPLREGENVENQGMQRFQLVLEKIKEIKDLGFTNDELEEAKRKCIGRVQVLQTEAPTVSRDHSFRVQGFVSRLDNLSYEAFYHDAIPLLESITPVDIAIVMHEYFTKDQCAIYCHGISPTNVTHAQQVIEGIESVNLQPHLAFVQTEMEAPQDLFDTLVLHENERAIIFKIFDTMARDNVIKLGFKRKTMEKRGKKIRSVHPLRLLAYIFGDPHLHHCMREISRSSFKWNGFIDGMRDRIEDEARKGQLLPFVPGFASQLHVDENKVRHYIERHDWDGLARSLL